jgi:hypothetical protein
MIPNDSYEDDSLMRHTLDMLEHIQSLINENTDPTPMVIGDRVIPWDGSALTTMDGTKACVIYEPFTSTKFWIVVETGVNAHTDQGIAVYRQDIVIAHPITKVCYRTSSMMVKHFEPNK